MLDAASARRFSAHGHSRATTPHFDARAAEGVLFEQAQSQTATTVSSIWSLFSGRYAHRIGSGRRGYRLLRSDEPMALRFQQAGYETAAFSENPHISDRRGFGVGFMRFDYREPLVAAEGSNALVRGEASRDLLEGAEGWIADRPSKFFAYVHLLRPHNPYAAPEGFLQRFVAAPEQDVASVEAFYRLREQQLLRPYFRSKRLPSARDVALLGALYDGNLAYVDALVDDFLDRLAARGALRDVLVVVVGDHGEGFGEHGRLLHGEPLYQEQIHVPLLFWTPEPQRWTSRRVEAPVETRQLLPTFAELFGLGAPPPEAAASLVPLLSGPAGATGSALSEQTSVGSIAYREGPLKVLGFVDAEGAGFERIEAYDLVRDPFERVDRREELPVAALVERIERHLEEFGEVRRRREHRVRTDPATRDQLEALGYLE